MWRRVVLVAACVCQPFAFAGDGAIPDSLQGTWEAQQSDSNEVWELSRDGAIQSFVRTENGKVTLKLKCKPSPGECHGVDRGKAADVSSYTSGPALVHLEVNDTNLIVRRFVVEGQVLTIEARRVTGQAASRVTRLLRKKERPRRPDGTN